MTTSDDEMVAPAVFEAGRAEDQPRTYAAVLLTQRAAENRHQLAPALRRGSGLDPAALSCGCLSGFAIDVAHPPNVAAAKIEKLVYHYCNFCTVFLGFRKKYHRTKSSHHSWV
jgi:hypothetical protein